MIKSKKKSKKSNSSKPSGQMIAATNFFAEAGLLKRIKRSGWWVVGIKDPESVAEHCFRTAVIGFYLAHLEGADPYKVLVMTLFNDIHESRINDLHKMGHFYIDFKEAEQKVFRDQIKTLEDKVKSQLQHLRKEFDFQQTKESLIARDADILECLLQAKEYFDSGYRQAQLFFNKAPQFLKTRSALRIWQTMKTWDSFLWWQNITKFER